MTVDLLNDLVILWGFKIHLTTIIGWLSGVFGLYANYRQMVKLNAMEDTKARERGLKELSERCYLKIERVAKLTPSKLDDKLLSYMKLAFESYKTKFNKKPTPEEVKELIENAEQSAAKSKEGSNK